MCALRRDWLSPKKKLTHPILIETGSYRRPSGRLQAVRCGQITYASLRFAFWGNVSLSTSTHRHYDEVYIASNNLPVEIIRFHTIGFSDILSRIRNSTTTRYVFIADRSFRKIGISTSQLHYFMLLCTGSSPGKSVQAPIRL